MIFDMIFKLHFFNRIHTNIILHEHLLMYTYYLINKIDIFFVTIFIFVSKMFCVSRI